MIINLCVFEKRWVDNYFGGIYQENYVFYDDPNHKGNLYFYVCVSEIYAAPVITLQRYYMCGFFSALLGET